MTKRLLHSERGRGILPHGIYQRASGRDPCPRPPKELELLTLKIVDRREGGKVYYVSGAIALSCKAQPYLTFYQ